MAWDNFPISDATDNFHHNSHELWMWFCRVFVPLCCLSLNQTYIFLIVLFSTHLVHFSLVFCISAMHSTQTNRLLLAHTYAIHCGILQPLPILNGMHNNGKWATVPRQLIHFCNPWYHNGHIRRSEILSVTLKRMSRWSRKPAVASLRPHKRTLGSQTRKI